MLPDISTMDFSKANLVPTFANMKDVEGKKIINQCVKVTVSKGAIAETDFKTQEYVKEVMIDDVYSFESEKEVDRFIEYIKAYK